MKNGEKADRGRRESLESVGLQMQDKQVVTGTVRMPVVNGSPSPWERPFPLAASVRTTGRVEAETLVDLIRYRTAKQLSRWLKGEKEKYKNIRK